MTIDSRNQRPVRPQPRRTSKRHNIHPDDLNVLRRIPELWKVAWGVEFTNLMNQKHVPYGAALRWLISRGCDPHFLTEFLAGCTHAKAEHNEIKRQLTTPISSLLRKMRALQTQVKKPRMP